MEIRELRSDVDRLSSFADEASWAADHTLNVIKENLWKASKESILYNNYVHDDSAWIHMYFQCLAPDAVMYYINAEEETAVAANTSIDQIAAVIVYEMFEGKIII